tara:strand:+ start:64 stop:1470 length:1407 start_codon:yes stop_codon:yes gene_type:complete
MAVAGLPMRPDMFKAGGGIVAFQEGGLAQQLAEVEKRIAAAKAANQTPSYTDLLDAQKLKSMVGVQAVGDRYQKNLSDMAIESALAEPTEPKNRFQELMQSIASFVPDPIGDQAKKRAEQIVKERKNKELVEGSESPYGGLNQDEIINRLMEVGGSSATKQQTDQPTDQPTGQPLVTDQPDQTIITTPELSVQDAFSQVRSMLSPKNVAKDGAIGTEIEAPEDFTTQAMDIMKKAGVDFNNTAQKAALEKEKAALAGDKKEAVYMSLLELGFAIMGGKDPNAIVNIGKAGMQVAPALAKRIQATKDARRRVLDSELKLEELKNRRAEGVANITSKMIQNAENNRQANMRNERKIQFDLTRQILGDNRAMRVAEIQADATLKANRERVAATQTPKNRIVELQKLRDSYPEGSPQRIQIEKALAELMGFEQSLKATSRQAVIDAIRDKGGSGGSFTPDPEKDAYLKKYLE